MVPGILLGLLFFAAAVCPGYWWLRGAERWQPRQDRAPLLETAELFAVGGLFSAFAVAAVTLIVERVGFIDISSLARHPHWYFEAHPARVLFALLISLFASNVTGWLGGAALQAGGGRRIGLGTSALNEFVGGTPSGSRAFITAVLRGGSSVAGWFHGSTVPPAPPEEQELVLVAAEGVPLRLMDRSGAETQSADDFVILNGTVIDALYGQFRAFPPHGRGSSSDGEHRTDPAP